ncbi:MAG: homoserine kinase, partial [Haliangium ochraceum]
MAQFRVLSAADVSEILTAFGYSPDAYAGHRPIAAGTVNTNVRVDTNQGPRFLRVNEGKSLDDVAREAAIVDHVARRAGRDLETPVPGRSSSGEPFARWRGQVVSLFPWLNGRTLQRADVTAGHAHGVGRRLALLHQVGTSFPDRRPGRYEPPEIDRRLEAIAAVAGSDAALQDALALLRPELRALRAERTADLPSGIIHGDLFIDNVLFDGDRLVAVLDFEQAAWGRCAYDLAVTMLAFAFGRDDFRPDIVAALFDGYQIRAITASERQAFGAELRFAACRFAVTRITDVYLKRGTGAAPGKDFRRYLQRLERVKHHLATD